MSLFRKKAVFAAKVEATPGTAETLASADAAFLASEMNIQRTSTVIEREATGSFGKRASSVSGARGSYSFRIDLAWDGTTTLPAFATVLLAGCGYVNSSGTLTPRSEDAGANVKTLTIGKYIDGVYKRLCGCAGNARFVMKAGDQITIEFTFEGVWVAPTDTAMIAHTPPALMPWKAAAATTTYDGVAMCWANCTIDLGNELYLEECANTATGFSKCVIVDRKPMITIDPEAVTVAVQNRYGMFDTEDENVFSLAIARAGATITFAAPRAQIVSIEEGERNKIVIENIELQCNKNGAVNDQDLSIDFQEAT